jgi:hypothetical protein
MKIAICQPTYLPWIGYFDLIDQVEAFVVLDDVQFEKQSWQQRNRIKTPLGLQWLTVPVMFRGRLGQLIKDVEVRDFNFWRNHCRAIELNYRRALFFDAYFEKLASQLVCSNTTLMANLNIRLMEWFMSIFGIKTLLILSSSLAQTGRRTERLVNICKSLGADQYISPLGSAAYLLEEREMMADHGIDLVFQNYQHPEYRQQFTPFIPYASALDLLFNEGEQSLEVIKSGRRAPLLPAEVAAQLIKHAYTE